MTLTDEQCAELSEWSLARAAGLPLEQWPRAVMDYDIKPGMPVRTAEGIGEVRLHPEDWLSLHRWVQRQAPEWPYASGGNDGSTSTA